ncbi:hypothetical protein TSAR_003699, partial [Trichomalopsis sarcophagae]
CIFCYPVRLGFLILRVSAEARGGFTVLTERALLADIAPMRPSRKPGSLLYQQNHRACRHSRVLLGTMARRH